MDLIEILNRVYYENSVISYFYAFTAFVITIFILIIIKNIFIKKIVKITNQTELIFDDLILYMSKVFNWNIYLLAALYISFKFIKIPQIFSTVIGYAIIALGAYYLVKFIQIIIDLITNKTIKAKGKDQLDKTAIDFISRSIKLLVWIIAILMIIQNLGYDVTTIIAGLGIGGIAIALALQNVLRDLFASLSIFFDKPFKIGDYIKVGKDQGTVIKIGLRSTKLKTLKGNIFIISNKELVESRVYNYQGMKDRKIFFKIKVTHDTPAIKLKKISKIVENIISNIKEVKLKRIHFVKFGDYSLDFDVVYLILSNNFVKYLDINQKIHYKIREEFEKEGIKMAYPTQTVIVKKT